MDLIPTVYDTKRVLYALQPGGDALEVQIDPQAAQHYQMVDQANAEAASCILNPKKGKYEVVAEVGPDWGTKREETVQSLTLIATQAPQIAPLVADLLLKSMDFDLADEAAERLRRMVPPQALGEGPSAQEQALLQQVQDLTKALSNVEEYAQKTAEKNVGLRMNEQTKEAQKEIDVYKAETDRMKALADQLDPENLSSVIKQLVEEALSTHLQKSVSKIDDQSISGQKGPVQDTGLLPPSLDGNGGGNGSQLLGNPSQGGLPTGGMAGLAS
jgi:hypothetical protein